MTHTKDEALASPKDAALKLALYALKLGDTVFYPQTSIAIAAIEKALAQGETSSPRAAQEPVALVIDGVLVKSELPEKYTGHLYTTPQQRPWVELTDGEIDAEANSILTSDPVQWWRILARAVLAKSKEKNT